MLQFITDIKAKTPVSDQILKAIEGGCRWVTISTEGASSEEIKKIVEAVKPTCVEKEVFLIMDSDVELAKECNVGGVFLHKDGVPCSKARMELGPAAVIGVEASSMADVHAVSALDIDYFGLPFGSEALDIDKIRDMCYHMEKEEIAQPRVVFGDIQLSDLLPLIEAGANGVAVSSPIAEAADIKEATAKFIKAMPGK